MAILLHVQFIRLLYMYTYICTKIHTKFRHCVSFTNNFLVSLDRSCIFFVLQPEMSASAQRQAKKDNPEREREATLTRDSTPTSVRVRVHTPHTYPRTKHPAQLRALENLRQVLPFDEVCLFGNVTFHGVLC